MQIFATKKATTATTTTQSDSTHGRRGMEGGIFNTLWRFIKIITVIMSRKLFGLVINAIYDAKNILYMYI